MDMSITKTSSALTIHWSEGDAGGGPVTGYVIETRASGEPSEREKKRMLCIREVGGAELPYTKPQRAAFMPFIKTRCAIES